MTWPLLFVLSAGALAIALGLLIWSAAGDFEDDLGEENADEESSGRVVPGPGHVGLLPRDRRGRVNR